MDWNGCGRKLSYPIFKALSQLLSGGIEENIENFQSE
jgi:hypothetical protein